MKLQTGLLSLDGYRASSEDIAHLLAEFADRPVDVSGETLDGPALICYRGDRITFEEDSEVQPLRKEALTLTWDGRLDNREDVGRRIGLRVNESVPDPEIVLRAYQQLGDSIIQDLIGEFALVLWCGSTKTLKFARSACGARTLYYFVAKNRIIWSSDFAHLVRVSEVDLAVNDDYAIQYLVSQPSAKDSPLMHVHPVPPNRLVYFQDGRFKRSCELWDPTRISPLRYRTDQEYEEQFRAELTDAVRVRLRARGPVFSELSGGLDSSSVVLIADQVLREQGRSPTNLQTVSCIYEESRSCDETPFIRAVEDRRGRRSWLIGERDQRITLGLDNPPFTGIPNPLHCFPGRYQRISSLIRQNEGQVLLTGGGGDHLFWSEPDGTLIVADELRRASFLRAHRACLTWSEAAHTSYYQMLLARSLPLAFRSRYSQRFGYKRPELPVWIHPRLRETYDSKPPSFDQFTSWRSEPSKRAQLFFIDNMFRQLGAGVFMEYPDLYVSHPYSHRSLLEFCLAVPVSQFVREGQTRSLMRRSLQKLLPQETARRVSKGLLDETLIKALQREWDTLGKIQEWQACRLDHVIPAELMHCLTSLRLGMLRSTGAMFRLFSWERWLRSLDDVSSSPSRSDLSRLFTSGPSLHVIEGFSG